MAVIDQEITERELWLDIPNYEGLYQISSWGRVRSLTKHRQTGWGIRRVRERIVKPKPGKYLAVSLSHCGDPKTFNVHTLVLSAFVGPCPEGMEACHFDGNKWNCRLDNLRWDTPTGNHSDRVRHGVSNRGERCGTAKITNDQAATIVSKYATGNVFQRELAAEFGISQAQVNNIVNGRRHLTCQ